MLQDLPPLVLGGNVFGWTADAATSFRILDTFVDAGGVMIDSAEVYSSWAPGNVGGESEQIIGRWLKANPAKRDQVMIVTKVGFEGSLAPDRVRAACDASLARLGTERIDLYYQHKDDPAVPLADSLGTFHELIGAGKIGAIGLSNFEAPRIEAAIATCQSGGVTAPVALQNWYNLVERKRYEEAIQPVAVRLGLAQFPYYGLASGFLSGKYRPGHAIDSPRSGRAAAYLDDARGQAVLAALDEIARESGEAHAAIALAWLKRQQSVVAPVASVSRPAQLDALLRAMTLELTTDQAVRLDEASRWAANSA